MRRLVTGTIGALLLVAAMVAPTLAHTATVTCDHITFGKVPAGVSAVLTPGPITIAPANATTSIDGTYEVPPATYLITFSDGSVIHSRTVPACPSPSPSSGGSTPPSSSPSTPPSSSPSTPPSSGPSNSPSAAPSTIDTPGPSTSITPAPSPSGSSGGVLGATATPRTTAPATDALADPPSNGFGTSLPLLVFLLAGINVGLVLILRTPSHPRGRSNRG
jgi:hypothetical protein